MSEHNWLLDVIEDLRTTAQRDGFEHLCHQLDAAKAIAKEEIAQKTALEQRPGFSKLRPSSPSFTCGKLP